MGYIGTACSTRGKMNLTEYLEEKHGEENVIASVGGVVISPDCDCEHC